MERLNRLVFLPSYQQAYQAIQQEEENREFCGHNFEHFFDVARIAWILNLEEQLQVQKEVVYTAAFLHDIGRHLEYTKAIPHSEASVDFAGPMLKECGYTKKESGEILEAIRLHGKKQEALSSPCALVSLLYRADKASRNCFACFAKERCDWEQEKKNLNIVY